MAMGALIASKLLICHYHCRGTLLIVLQYTLGMQWQSLSHVMMLSDNRCTSMNLEMHIITTMLCASDKSHEISGESFTSSPNKLQFDPESHSIMWNTYLGTMPLKMRHPSPCISVISLPNASHRMC